MQTWEADDTTSKWFMTLCQQCQVRMTSVVDVLAHLS